MSLAGCATYVPGDAAYDSGHYDVARNIYESKYQLGSDAAGLRLATMYINGIGGAAEPEKGVKIYRELASRGVAAAEHNLGHCYEYGNGVEIDYKLAAMWYRQAGDNLYVPAIYNLGSMYANGYINPKDDIEGLTLLLEAAKLSNGVSGEKARFVRDDPPGHRQQLVGRMDKVDVAVAEKQASERVEEFRTKGKGAPAFEESLESTSQP